MFLNELISVTASNTTYNLKTRVYFTITNAAQGLKSVNQFLNRFIYMHHLNELIHLNESDYWLKPVILSRWHEYRCPDYSHGSVPLKTRITNENKPHNLQDSPCIQYSHISINLKNKCKNRTKTFTAVLLTHAFTVIVHMLCCFPAVFVSLDTEVLVRGKQQQIFDLLGHRSIRKRQRHKKSCWERASAVQPRAKLHSRLFTTFTCKKLLQL